jgi:hypothetical protein
MLLGRLVRMLARELFHRLPCLAVAPFADVIGDPHLVDPFGRVAARVARVRPKRGVEVEIFGREEIH